MTSTYAIALDSVDQIRTAIARMRAPAKVREELLAHLALIENTLLRQRTLAEVIDARVGCTVDHEQS